MNRESEIRVRNRQRRPSKLLLVLALAFCSSCSDQSGGGGGSLIHQLDVPPSPYNLNFNVPNYTPAQQQAVLAKYQYVDPNKTVPLGLLTEAILYYEFNWGNIVNHDVITIVNFSSYSADVRLFTVDMNTGDVTAYHVSHGMGSDPDTTQYPTGSGYARTFSNVINSDQSSLGFYLVAEPYTGEHGLSIRLDGLSSTNSNARVRAIVVHEADYVYEENVKQGRSDGCFAIANSVRDKLVALMSGGSILLAGLGG
jgi:hypothetical protein